MSVILADCQDNVEIVRPDLRTMKALTNGGLGKLPGDAVTTDLAENESRRIAVSSSMPLDRAIDNMVRDGYDSGFAAQWCKALLNGGETDASALGLLRQHTPTLREKSDADIAAVDESTIPTNRMLRNAWRKQRDSVTIDVDASKIIFAQRIIAAKSACVIAHKNMVETAMLSGKPSDDLERAYNDMLALDLRAIGARVMAARSVDEVLALWPIGLGEP